MDDAIASLEGSIEPIYTPQGGTEVIEYQGRLPKSSIDQPGSYTELFTGSEYLWFAPYNHS